MIHKKLLRVELDGIPFTLTDAYYEDPQGHEDYASFDRVLLPQSEQDIYALLSIETIRRLERVALSYFRSTQLSGVGK